MGLCVPLRASLLCTPALVVETATLPPRWRQSLVDPPALSRVCYPREVPVCQHCGVARVYEHHLEPRISTVTPHPVAAEDIHVGVPLGYPLLSDPTGALAGGDSIDAHPLWAPA